MSIEKLSAELKNFYYNLLPEARDPNIDSAKCQPSGYRHPFEAIMDGYDASHPGLGVYQLKAMQYEVIADNFKPVIFKNSPFYFEMGTKISQCDGAPWFQHPGIWLLQRNYHLFRDSNPEEYDLFYHYE